MRRSRVDPEPGFGLRMSCTEDGHVLGLTGELDIANAEQVEAALRRLSSNGTSALTLDLSGLTFMGSTGLRMVLLARQLCSDHGCEFRVIPGPANVQRVFEITGVGQVIPFTPS